MNVLGVQTSPWALAAFLLYVIMMVAVGLITTHFSSRGIGEFSSAPQDEILCGRSVSRHFRPFGLAAHRSFGHGFYPRRLSCLVSRWLCSG